MQMTQISSRMVKVFFDIENELNEELSEIVRWLKINKLTLNVDKTQCMLFSNKKCSTNLNIKIEGTTIAQVSKAKFLGIMMDDKLKWKDHILYISNKISKGIGVIIKARVLGKNTLLSLYYSLVYPYTLTLLIVAKYGEPHIYMILKFSVNYRKKLSGSFAQKIDCITQNH